MMFLEITKNKESEFKKLKIEINEYLKNNFSENYRIEDRLKKESERWYRECCNIMGSFDSVLKELAYGTTIEIKDEIGFPFEILRYDGFYLGEKFRFFRSSGNVQNKEQVEFSFGTLFDQDKKNRSKRIEETILIKPENLNNKIYDQSIIFFSGHFDNVKDTISKYSFNNNSFLFFNFCNSFDTIDMLKGKYTKYALSYFDIPIDPDYKIFDEFPLYFFSKLIEGESIIDSFWEAKKYSINKHHSVLPLLFSIFIPTENDTHFKVFMKKNRKEVLGKIERKFSLTSINTTKTEVKNNYPDIFFNYYKRKKTLQYIINDISGSNNDKKQHIWIKGEKSGSGKTTLLLKQFLNFQYKQVPVYFSFQEKIFKDIDLIDLDKILQEKLGKQDIKGLQNGNIRPLLLIDALDSNKKIYENQKSFIDIITKRLNPLTIVITSKKNPLLDVFHDLDLDENEYISKIKDYYEIPANIKFPEIPRLFELIKMITILNKDNIKNGSTLNKSNIFEKYIFQRSEKVFNKEEYKIKYEYSFLYYFSFIASFMYKKKSTYSDVIHSLDEIMVNDTNWWIKNNNFKPLDGREILDKLLETGIILKDEESEYINFINNGFYEFLLAHYFFWKYKEEPEYSIDLKYSEIPDYMKELLGKSDMSKFGDVYIKIIFERLLNIKEYKEISDILKDNIKVFERSEMLSNVLIPGYYFAREEVNAIETFYVLKVFDKYNNNKDSELSDSFFYILNILFDNWLMDDFFKFAHFLEDKVENKIKIYGLLSRGYLKIGDLERSSSYLKKKEDHIGKDEKADKTRLENEKGLLNFFKYKKGKKESDYENGVNELNKAATLYSNDIREEGNYLFTLREKLLFYFETKNKGEIENLQEEIDKINKKDHPRNDYIQFLSGLADIELFENKEEGLKKIKYAAEAFEKIMLGFEATVVYLFLWWYSKDDKALKKAKRIFKILRQKRNEILQYWKKIKTENNFLNNQKIPQFEDQFAEVKKILETTNLKRDDELLKKIKNFTLIS